MSNIKQWQERVEDGSSVYENQEAMQAEIADLRTAAQQALEALKGWPGKPRAAFEILTAALESKP